MYSCQSLGKLSRKEKRNAELMELTTEQKSSTFRGTAGTACRAPSLTLNSRQTTKAAMRPGLAFLSDLLIFFICVIKQA